MSRENNFAVFKSQKGIVTYGDIKEALYKVGANECEVLFIHSEINFGRLADGIRRKELCSVLIEALKETGVETLIFPTFTFSFSNYEDYNMNDSKTRMGMLNEFARNVPGTIRTVDPMTSVCILGKENNFSEIYGTHSVGEGSIFDILHKSNKKVSFLFLGAEIPQCFTHMHYVEEALRVPYRYDMDFQGKRIDVDGKEENVTYTLFVKYRDVLPCVPESFEKELIDKGIAKKEILGDSHILCMSERESYAVTKEWLERDVNAFLEEPYDTKPLVKEYHFGNVTTIQ